MVQIDKITPCHDFQFVKPQCVHYTQDGKAKKWEIVQTHDSVAILLYARDRDAFVLVKQFRPAIYLKNGDGYTYELCAGLIDKADKSVETIAREEILEECGYDVSEEKLERITSFFTAVGFAGGEQTLFFAEVDKSMQVGPGGGIEDEVIEVVDLPLEDARNFMFDESLVKTPGLLFAFMWFFARNER